MTNITAGCDARATTVVCESVVLPVPMCVVSPPPYYLCPCVTSAHVRCVTNGRTRPRPRRNPFVNPLSHQFCQSRPSFRTASAGNSRIAGPSLMCRGKLGGGAPLFPALVCRGKLCGEYRLCCGKNRLSRVVDHGHWHRMFAAACLCCLSGSRRTAVLNLAVYLMARITSRDNIRFVSHEFCHCARPSLCCSGARRFVICVALRAAADASTMAELLHPQPSSHHDTDFK